MKKLQYSLWTKILTIGIFILAFSSCFSPGSYPNAEEYEINTNELELIKAIQEFKKENPIYCPPEQLMLNDGRSNDRDDHWYHVYMYYPDENQIIYFWVRGMGKNTSIIAFVGINEGLALGNWRDINKDFSSSENKVQKKKFETRILNKLIERLELK